MSESLQRTGKDFETFYEKYYKQVYRMAYTYMKNSADAEDVTEDVFVRVLVGSFDFEDEEHERRWLFTVTVNLCKDRLKHWWKKRVSSVDDCPEQASEDEISTDETLTAVMALPTKYKDVIYLHYYMDYKTDEIAEMLKRPPSTVRNQLREGRERLKIRLGGVIS